MTDNDGIDEVEVWTKFSAIHRYRRNKSNVMEYVSSDYFEVDPFGISPNEKISKTELIELLEPQKFPAITQTSEKVDKDDGG